MNADMWPAIVAAVIAGGTWFALRITDESRRVDKLLAAVRDTAAAENEEQAVR